MKIRTTLLLFGVFLLALLTFALFQLLGVQTGDERKHAERFVFPSLNPLVKAGDVTDPTKSPKGPQPARAEDFTKVVIERHRKGKPERLEFIRTSDAAKHWQMIHPLKARTDDSFVNGLVSDLINLEKQKSRDISRDVAKYGLDNPDTIVTLTRKNQDFTLSIGEPGKENDAVVYATSSENTGRPVMLSKPKISKLFDPVAAFRDKALISSSFNSTGLRLAGTARPALEVAKDKDWTFKEPAIGEADQATIEEVIRTLAGVRVDRNEDFVADGPLDAAKLEQYGLAEDKAQYIYAITQGAAPGGKSEVEKVIVGKADDAAGKLAAQSRSAALAVESVFNPTAAAASYVVREKNPPPPSYYFARRAGDDAVVRIPARILPQLRKTVDDLRAKALAKVDNSKVDAVNLVSGGETLRIRRTDLQGAAEWDVYADNHGKAKCHPQSVQNLLDALGKIEIRDTKAFLDDDAKIKSWFAGDTIDLGLDKPLAELTVWQEALVRNKEGKLEGTAEPALKEDVKSKPTVKFAIGKKDAKRQVVYVRREAPGQKAVTMAVPDPFLFGNATPPGPQQSFARPPDGRQTISLSALISGGYLAFRDHTLPSYRLDQVASLQLTRPGVTYLAEQADVKDDKGNLTLQWKLKQPVEGTPNATIQMVIPALMGTSADKLVADKASEKELEDTYGVGKAPLMRAIVSTRAETPKPDANAKEPPKPKPGSTFTYSVGKKIPEGAKFAGLYYARLEARPGDGPTPESNSFVFAVSLDYVQSFDLELRNTTVYPYEATKPAGVTITWHGEGADKKPTSAKMELALSGDKWEVKTLTENGADAKAKLPKLDERKVNAMLRYGPQPAIGGPNVNPLVADRFLQHAGTVDPKFRLDPGKTDLPPRLILEVKYTDGKMRTIFLGDVMKPDPAQSPGLVGTYHFAASPALPGAVLLLNENTWKQLVAGYAYFKEATATPQ